MADRAQAVSDNVPGGFFVDSTCIDCDTCRQLAPATFGDNGETSFVQLQPQGGEATRAALRALIACPTGSIGTAEKRGVSTALADFPMPLAPGVFYCGFNSRKSFGGNSYFVEHPEGNWLVDSPRFVEHLASRFADLGGIRYIFLTHRDDVADADKYAARFGATRIIHRLERSAQPDAERLLDGFDPIELAPGFLAIPTPGHTRGHCALLYKNEFLFAGDHMWWSRVRRPAECFAGRVLVFLARPGELGGVAGPLLVRVGAPRPRRARAFPARRDEAPDNEADRRSARRVITQSPSTP